MNGYHMNRIAQLMSELAPLEGFNETGLPGIRIYKTTTPAMGRTPLCYNQGVIFIGQGEKHVYLGGETYVYDPDNYLVLSVPIPAECETFTIDNKPTLAMLVDIDMTRLNHIIHQMDDYLPHPFPNKDQGEKGLFTASTSTPLKTSIEHLLKTLQSPMETKVLGDGLLTQLWFRIINGENGGSLQALAAKNTNISRIDKALKLIHTNYRETLDVNTLATLVNMSPSAFHRAFNSVTASSPIQYIKKIRLNKAMEMLIDRNIRVSDAAGQVGYESPAQFSREFKRYFGSSPSSYLRNLSS